MLKALSMRMVLNDWITNALTKFLERDGLLISVRGQLVIVVKGVMTIRNKLDPKQIAMLQEIALYKAPIHKGK